MSRKIGTASFPSTGTYNINLGFVPTHITCKVGALWGGSVLDTWCDGFIDVANSHESSITHYDDHAGHCANTDCGSFIWVRRFNGVSWGNYLLAEFNGTTATGFSITVLDRLDDFPITFDAQD